MACLLLRCVGPMQSWGSRSRFQERDTEREPTKSGIIGLLCAALGRDRAAPVDDLAALRLGVRVDMEGRVECDYHTALEVIKANQSGTETQISNRWYLADAAFLVGLEGDTALLETLHAALKNPRWPLFLGRKSFVPGCPVSLPDGLREEMLETALGNYPGIAPLQSGKAEKKFRLLLEDEAGEESRLDIPLDFRHAHRQFRRRGVRHAFIDAKPTREDACI